MPGYCYCSREIVTKCGILADLWSYIIPRWRANGGLMLAQRRRRWANIKPPLAQLPVLAGIPLYDCAWIDTRAGTPPSPWLYMVWVGQIYTIREQSSYSPVNHTYADVRLCVSVKMTIFGHRPPELTRSTTSTGKYSDSRKLRLSMILQFCCDPQLRVADNYPYLLNLSTILLFRHISFPITVIRSTNKTD